MSNKLDMIGEELSRCIKCGLCQAVCPIYTTTYAEQGVARGKLQLIKALALGEVGVTPRLKEIVALCLNCKACYANCPAKLPAHELILVARAHIVAKDGLPLGVEAMLKGLSSNSLLELGGFLLGFYQKSGVQKLIRGSGVMKAISPAMAKKEGLMPKVGDTSFRSIAGRLVRKGTGKYKVAYFVSCMTNMVGAEIGAKIVDVLERHDCQVKIVTDVRCCGAPHRTYGDLETAKKLATYNIKAFDTEGVDAIIDDCATCGSTLKGYGSLVKGAEEFVKKVYDISEFLTKITGIKPGSKEVTSVVTYHDSCHMGRGQGLGEPPRTLLRAIPGISFKEMGEADRCCGGAGSFGINHYDLSMQILDRKIENIKDSGAQIVVTGCPACKMQLQHGIERSGLQIKVKHPIELLAQTYLPMS